MTTSRTTGLSPGALDGIRVLDMTRVLAGPWCGQVLGDLGADVIKVERPGSGDDTRAWGPPFLKDESGEETSEAAYYLCANRNKRSVTIDLASSEGQEKLKTLASESDVLIENYKVGQLAQYGLSYQDLRRINPRLIYCSITGFGQTGPWSHRPGYDFIVQGLAGFMSVTGERDDLPGGGPQKAGVAISDLFTGLYSAIAILAALNHRHLTGEGQCIDMALFDVMVASMANMNTNYFVSGKPPGRSGNAHVNIVPYQVFRCSDGYAIVAVGNDGQFQKFSEAIGVPSLATDPDYATNPERVRHRDALIPILEERIATIARDHLIAALERAKVPCGPINTLDDVFENEQVLSRGMAIELPHRLAGSVRLVASPIRMSATPPTYRCAPPTLGQHNDDILGRSPGYSGASLAGNESD